MLAGTEKLRVWLPAAVTDWLFVEMSMRGIVTVRGMDGVPEGWTCVAIKVAFFNTIERPGMFAPFEAVALEAIMSLM